MILMDSRMKSKVEDVMELDNDVYSIKFKDLDDTFWFDSRENLQEFLNKQSVERFYDKSLRKGYFDYVNEEGDTLRYHVESKRGTLTLLKDECIDLIV